MGIQNTLTPVSEVADTTALSALISPATPLQVGSLAYVVSKNALYCYKPGSLGTADAFHVAAAVGGFWEQVTTQGDPMAAYRGMVEQPVDVTETIATGTILVTASEYTYRFLAKNGGAVANVLMKTTVAQATSTAATSITVTGAAAGTGGVIVLTFASTAGWVTGDIAVVGGVLGTTEANGTWQLTVIDGTTLSLNGSVFVNTWSAGGTQTAKRSVNTVAIYDQAGVWCGAAADQVAAWEGAAGLQTMAIANTAAPSKLTLNPGEWYYLVVIDKATTPATMLTISAASADVNTGLTAAKVLYGTLATSGVTKLPSVIVPANIVVTSNVPCWFALS